MKLRTAAKGAPHAGYSNREPLPSARRGPSRPFRATALILGVVLACTLTQSAAAQASAPNPGSIVAFSVDRSDPNAVTFTLTADVAVGDCVALKGGTLQVARPNTSGMTYVTWHQLSYTNHTKHYDQWHTDITILGAEGGSYLVPTSLDSAKMYTARQIYEWTSYSIIFPMTSALFAQINNLWWTVYC
jgi:hypothetical protein